MSETVLARLECPPGRAQKEDAKLSLNLCLSERWKPTALELITLCLLETLLPCSRTNPNCAQLSQAYLRLGRRGITVAQ